MMTAVSDVRSRPIRPSGSVGAKAAFDRVDYYERRATAVLAYCSRLCRPHEVGEALEASFAAAFDPAAADVPERNERLLQALRNWCAEHVAPGAGPNCSNTPRILVAGAEGEPVADDDFAVHLAECAMCTDVKRRFDEAERVFAVLMPPEARRRSRIDHATPFDSGARPRHATSGYPRPESFRPPRAATPRAPAPPAPPPTLPRAAPPPAPPPPPPRSAQSPRDARSFPAVPQIASRARLASPGPANEAAAPAAQADGLQALRRLRERLCARARLGPIVNSVSRRRFAFALYVVGALLMSETALTLLWKEPVTALVAARSQDALAAQLLALDRTRETPAIGSRIPFGSGENRRASTDARIEAFAHALSVRLRNGQALGRIEVRRIGINFVVVQGTGVANLRKGPAHYPFPQTVLPGQPGTVGIAGHRTTYLAPFRDIDALRRGDRIVVTMPYGRFSYVVEGRRIVDSSATDGFRDRGYPRLVLSACHPLYSAAQRILVSARLVSRAPLGQATSRQPN